MTDDPLLGVFIIMVVYNTLLAILKLVVFMIFIFITSSPFYLYYYYGHIWIEELFVETKWITKVIQTLIFFKRFIFISVYSLLILFFSIKYGNNIISYCVEFESYLGFDSVHYSHR